ncbi:MAG: hypothetical protein EP348_08640, partial [Alphaproteobacteria bacterium]
MMASEIGEAAKEAAEPPARRLVEGGDASPVLPVFSDILAFADEGAFPISDRSRAFMNAFFPMASDAEWLDWRWQLRNRIRTLTDLGRIFELT